MVGYETRGLAVAEEDDALFGEKGVDEDNDGMCEGAVCGEMRMEGKRLRVLGMGGMECCNELY